MEWMTTTLVQQIGLTLVHFLWQGIVIALLFAAAMAILRPTRAATRYNLAVVTLATLAVLPVATFVWLAQGTPATVAAGSPGVETFTLMAQQELSTSVGLLAWVVAFWLAGVILLSLRLLIGWRYLIRLRLTADRLACACMAPTLARLRNELGIVRRVQVAASKHIRSPVVIGWLRPLILFPPALINQLPMAQIEMVLAHELAHIRRHDHLVNLFQTVMETLFFYQPAVAWVSRQIRIERENACDDLAVSTTHDRLAYVEMLASLEQLRQPGSRLTLAIHDGQILGRIRRLVEQTKPSRQRGVTFPATLVILLAAGATGLFVMPEPDETANIHTEFLESMDSIEAPNEPGLTEYLGEGQGISDSLPELETAEAATVTPVASEPEPSEPLIIAQGPISDRVRPDAARPAPEPRRLTETAQAHDDARQAQPDAVANQAPEPQEPTRSASTPALPALDVGGSEADQAPELLLLATAIPLPRAAPKVESLMETEPEPITGGALVRKAEPGFPARARRQLSEGLVELEFVVDTQGSVRDIQVISETPGGLDFGRSATAAVKQWQYEPFRQGGSTIERLVRIEVEYTSPEGCLETVASRIPRC
jgi:bla regulator protein BlaR1